MEQLYRVQGMHSERPCKCLWLQLYRHRCREAGLQAVYCMSSNTIALARCIYAWTMQGSWQEPCDYTFNRSCRKGKYTIARFMHERCKVHDKNLASIPSIDLAGMGNTPLQGLCMNDARFMARTLRDYILQGALPSSCLAMQVSCNILASIFF